MSNGEAIVSFVLFIAGVALLVRGVAMWSPPAAWVVSGLALLVLAFWPVLRARLIS